MHFLSFINVLNINETVLLHEYNFYHSSSDFFTPPSIQLVLLPVFWKMDAQEVETESWEGVPLLLQMLRSPANENGSKLLPC